MIPLTIRVPLKNIAIDCDKQQAVLTFPDGDAFVQTILAAKANPEKAAILPDYSEDD